MQELEYIRQKLDQEKISFSNIENGLKLNNLELLVILLDKPNIKYPKEYSTRKFVVFYDELVNKKDLVLAMLLSRIGVKSKITLRASKLTLKKITNNVVKYREFFEKFHLDGYVAASSMIGLFDQDKLISACTFRFNRILNSQEIARFATDYEYRVHGNFSRIIKSLGKDINLVTYSNNRLSEGNVYKVNGFTEDKIEYRNNYFYTDGIVRLTRTKCQRSKAESVIKEFGKSEYEQNKNGYFGLKNLGKKVSFKKIYDLGNRRWSINYNTKSTEPTVYIYKYTDPKGKAYIGVTDNLHRRKIQHRSDITSPVNDMFKLYNEENIKCEVLEEVSGYELAFKKECEYISKFNSFKEGYNKTPGGEGCSIGKILDLEKVQEIVNLILNEKLTYQDIAGKFGVNEKTIRAIADRRYWSEVSGMKEGYTRKKLICKGEDQGSALLTTEQVVEIKKELVKGTKVKVLADRYNIKTGIIGAIKAGRNWSHVKVDGEEKIEMSNCSNKLDIEKAREIRRLSVEGLGGLELAKKFNLSRTTVHKIVTMQTWREK